MSSDAMGQFSCVHIVVVLTLMVLRSKTRQAVRKQRVFADAVHDWDLVRNRCTLWGEIHKVKWS